jgi:hypothetical protein
MPAREGAFRYRLGYRHAGPDAPLLQETGDPLAALVTFCAFDSDLDPVDITCVTVLGFREVEAQAMRPRSLVDEALAEAADQDAARATAAQVRARWLHRSFLTCPGADAAERWQLAAWRWAMVFEEPPGPQVQKALAGRDPQAAMPAAVFDECAAACRWLGKLRAMRQPHPAMPYLDAARRPRGAWLRDAAHLDRAAPALADRALLTGLARWCREQAAAAPVPATVPQRAYAPEITSAAIREGPAGPHLEVRITRAPDLEAFTWQSIATADRSGRPCTVHRGLTDTGLARTAVTYPRPAIVREPGSAAGPAAIAVMDANTGGQILAEAAPVELANAAFGDRLLLPATVQLPHLPTAPATAHVAAVEHTTAAHWLDAAASSWTVTVWPGAAPRLIPRTHAVAGPVAGSPAPYRHRVQPAQQADVWRTGPRP